eukprot:328985-Chlamydomonas_euryale.AAC.2
MGVMDGHAPCRQNRARPRVTAALAQPPPSHHGGTCCGARHSISAPSCPAAHSDLYEASDARHHHHHHHHHHNAIR